MYACMHAYVHMYIHTYIMHTRALEHTRTHAHTRTSAGARTQLGWMRAPEHCHASEMPVVSVVPKSTYQVKK